jgi:hypothetical protein
MVVRSWFAVRWMLTAAVVGLAIAPAGCFRSRMNPSKNCGPGYPCITTSGSQGNRDAGPGQTDAVGDAKKDVLGGPDQATGDGNRQPRDVGPETGDGPRDLGPAFGDGPRDLPGDGPWDVNRDGPRDLPGDGLLEARREVPADRGPEGPVCISREICGNGVDDDCNGLADCFDRACQTDPSCIDRKKETCDNGVDDDGNGLTDCADPACFGDKACVLPGKEICNNNLDDDDDGLIDCKDPDCAKDPSCAPHSGDEICDNGKDDNGDGLADCSDPKCKTFAACLSAACSADADFGAIAASGASVSRTLTTSGATASYGTCAPPGGVGRVAGFSLAAPADVRLDFTQGTGSAHVVAMFRAGVGQTCDQNPVDCLKVGDKASATQTYNALAAGNYWVVVESYPGTTGTTTVTLSTGKTGTTEVCDNGKDDDGDGAIDCADLDCASSTVCNLCVPDINLGTIALDGSTKTATLDTTTTANRYHPTCTGLSTGNDAVVRFSVKETVGLTLNWTQTGDHMYGFFDVPTQGQRCDTHEQGCQDMQDRYGTTNWSYFEPGDYLLIFKARAAGQEGKISIGLTAFANRKTEICDNGIDDDGDRLVDCADPDCFGVPVCSAPMCMTDGDLGDLDIGTSLSVKVDLTSATQVFKSQCGKGDGRGRAYRLNVLSPMELDVSCTQTGDQVLQFSLQTGPLDLCDANIVTCADPATLPGGCNFGLPSMQPGTYFLLVEGFTKGSEGTVGLTLRGRSERVLEICNNGIDDDGDGAIDCNDRKCATDDTCTKLRCRADKSLGLLALDGTPLSVAVQTSGAGNDQTKSTCTSAATGADAVVGFSLPGKTDLTVQWAQVGNHALVLYQADSAPLPCEANALIDCKSTAGATTGSYVLKGLPAGPYNLVLDADKAGSEGGAILQISGTQAQ